MSDWRYWSIEGGLIRQGASAATILSRQCQPANATANKPTRAHTRTVPVCVGLGAGSSLVSNSRRACCSTSSSASKVARERAGEKKRQCSEETRRKILVGAVILAKVEHGEWPKERLRELMDKALTRADDRALFGLLPVQAPPNPAGPSAEGD
jgi:hypothetical protein